MDTQNATFWIEHLELQPHPEGGYYKEVFRSQQEVTRPPAPGVKQACTSIYYLLEGTDYSGFHRLASDELWYFHKGVPLIIHVINKVGGHKAIELSDKITGSLSVAIEAGIWFGAEIPAKKGYALVSCAVAPGFEFNEFEMANKQELIGIYPQHTNLLNKLCH